MHVRMSFLIKQDFQNFNAGSMLWVNRNYHHNDNKTLWERIFGRRCTTRTLSFF